MRNLPAILTFVSASYGALHFVRLRSPGGMRFMMIRILAGALAPVWCLFGAIGAVTGLVRRRPLLAAAGLAGLAASSRYMVRVRRAAAPHAVSVPAGPLSRPEVRRDVVLRITDRPSCAGEGARPVYGDLWLPAEAARHSGLGVVYLHGSGWYLGDKGQMTGPLFTVLTQQGHVVLDVAYRMCPETDLRGMIADARAAIVWLKEHAAEFGVDPARIVVSGTSAGGHIALLTAFTADRTDVSDVALDSADARVAGVFTISAPIDMRAMVRHHRGMVDGARVVIGAAYDPDIDHDPLVPPGPGATRWEQLRWERAQARRLGGLMHDLLGGGPADVPEMFDLASAGTHVRPGLPPTLLIQGDQDVLVPWEPAAELHEKLSAAGVRSAYLALPQTDHAFELVLPHISPPARAAYAAIRAFLATV